MASKKRATKKKAAGARGGTRLAKTPSKGKKGLRVSAARYEAMRGALLKAVPRSAKGVAFLDLPDLVRPHLPGDWAGDVKWHVTVVKLDMETKGEIERVPGVTPQRLRRASAR